MTSDRQNNVLLFREFKSGITGSGNGPTLDGTGGPPDNGGMDERVKKLEDGQHELKTQLVRIEARLEHIEKSIVTKTEISELRVEVLTNTASAKTAVADIRSDLYKNTESAKTAVADIRSDLHKMDASIKTWMIGTVIGLMVGFGGLFLNMNKSTAPQSQPIVIYTPTAQPQQPAPPSK